MKCSDFPQLKQQVEELGRAGKWVSGALGWLVRAGEVVGRIKTGCLNGYEGGRGEERFWLKGRITNLVLFSGPWFDLSPPNPFDFPCPAFLASIANYTDIPTVGKVQAGCHFPLKPVIESPHKTILFLQICIHLVNGILGEVVEFIEILHYCMSPLL
jgi:hypothetical protein